MTRGDTVIGQAFSLSAAQALNRCIKADEPVNSRNSRKCRIGFLPTACTWPEPAYLLAL